MEKHIKKINKIWMIVFIVLAIACAALAIIFLNLNVSKNINLKQHFSTQALIFLLLAIYTVLNSIICIYTNMSYGSDKFDKKLWLWAVLHTLFGCIPVGIILIVRVVKNIKQNRIERKTYLAELAQNNGDIKQGYDSQEKTIVRLVKPNHRKKEYQVSGLDDVASRNNWKGWLYLAPVIVLIGVFLLYPLINTIIIAFTKNYDHATNTGDGFTLQNFGLIFGISTHQTAGGQAAQETDFLRFAVPNTLLLTFVTVPVSIFLALIIAVALNSIKWFQKALQTIFFLPYVTNTIAIGMVFSVLFDKQGLINSLFNLKFPWIYNADPKVAMIPLCIYIVWNSIPFKILILLSGLQGVDKQYYQAAQIDAAPKWKVLTKITVPLLSPQILYLMITSFIGAFKEYTSIVAIFGGPSTRGEAGKNEPNMLTIVYYVYERLGDNVSYGAAGAVFLFVVILIFTFVQFGVSSKRVHY